MKTRHQINFRSTENELRLIADAAKVAGVSKTEFMFSAAIDAAKRFGIDPAAYFVSEANATPQNTGANAFLAPKEIKKLTAEQASAGAGRGAIAKQRPLGSGKQRSV